jgi:crotonobetainyl-CoA:carnitine CoA-transferase CaiB-like acyl-CoA transferase
MIERAVQDQGSQSAAVTRALPLTGVRVLDFGQALQGPYASFLLAMAGADVIKVEPLGGEMTRAAGATAAYTFELLNACKRGLSVNLKKARGRDIVLQMASTVDVVVENFAPGVMERLGLGPDDLLKANPRLVYASGTAYGLSGPMRDSVGMDATIQAVSGLTAATGDPDGAPMRAGLPVADILAGTHLYAGITTALVDARTTGRGRVVEVSMLESMFHLQVMNLGLWHRTGRTQAPPRLGNRHGAVGPHNAYRASDGWVAILCATDRHWSGLTAAMERPDLADDPALRTAADRVGAGRRLDAEIAAWTKPLTRDEVCARCTAHRVPAASVRDTVEVLNDPHMRARGFLTDIDHPALGPTTFANSAIRYGDSALRTPAPAPKLGADTDELLQTLCGLSASSIADLHRHGVVA